MEFGYAASAHHHNRSAKIHIYTDPCYDWHGSRRIIVATQSAKHWPQKSGNQMNKIIYLVGLVVVVLFILGFLGLR